MEHSYTRDFRLLESSQTAMTRTLMVHRPSQCPSCHSHSHDERIDLDEQYNPPIPSYNEESARKAMQESENIATTARNSASDEDDWEEKVNKFGWSVQQFKLFDRVARLLDMDRLARLTNTEKQHEPVHRRTVIDKSVSRLRQALGSVSWETRLTQWLHVLLMENLPPCYLAIYIDILQTLHAKLPLLVNEMVFGSSSLNINRELLGPVLKKPWEPIVSHKNRKLPGQPYIVVVPSVPNYSQPTARQQKWYSLFATMASVIPIQVPQSKTSIEKVSLQVLLENMVAITRTKIQQVRNTNPNRSIILVGFDAGAALAVQVALVESVSCVICLGFSYNTYNGVRSTPDDHIIDIPSPALFIIGQNSARASHEEIEMLRERMVAQTSLVVVGSADECLRVSKAKRKIEGITQSMVDNMVADEIAEFATNCLLSPPSRPKLSGQSSGVQFVNGSMISENIEQGIGLSQRNKMDVSPQRKRKLVQDLKEDFKLQKKSYIRRPMKPETTRPGSQMLQETLDIDASNMLTSTPEKPIQSERVIITAKQNINSQTHASVSDANQIKYEIRESGNTQIISAPASTPIMLPALRRETAQTPSGTLQQPSNVNVKLIDSNQLIHLKPATGTMQKFYSLKSSTKPVVSVMANTSGTTIVNDSGIQAAEISSPPKFTIVRNLGSTPTVFNNSGETDVANKSTKDLSETNIFDLPIVFADNDGFIQEGSPEKPKPDTRQVSGPVVTSVTTIGGAPSSANVEANVVPVQSTANRFVTLQQPAGSVPITIGKSKQMVNLVINKGALKPVEGSMIVPVGTKINLPMSVVSNASSATVGSTVVASGASVPKFTKVLLTKSLTTSLGTGVAKNLGELFSSGKVEFVNSAGVKQTGITGTPVTMSQGKFQSIVINPFGGNKLQSSTGSVGAGESNTVNTTVSGTIPIIGGNKILIKTTASALTAANTTGSLVGRNVTLKRFNIVSSATGIKSTPSSIMATSSEAVPKEK